MQPTNLHLDHDEVAELLAAYALGVLTPEEEAAVEAHLATCERCRTELAELRRAVEALPLVVDELEPPPGLRERIYDLTQEGAGERGRPQPATIVPFYRRPLVSWLAAAVLLLAVIGMGAWNLRLRQDLNQGVVAFSLQSPTGAPVQGKVFYLKDHQMAVFDAEQLPPLPPGQVYEMWLIQGNNPVPAGVFTNPQTDQAMKVNLDQYQVFALTIEAGPDGSPQPTGKPFAVATIRQSD